jgi:hypothetical protein
VISKCRSRIKLAVHSIPSTPPVQLLSRSIHERIMPLTQCSSAQDVAPETSAGPVVADVSAIADVQGGEKGGVIIVFRV